MCVVCGCGEGETTVSKVDEGQAHDHGHGHPHAHTHADGTTHTHGHGHDHDHGHAHEHTRDVQVPGRDAQTIALEVAVLGKNQALAERNRGWLAGRGVLALNLMSSPGAGKTTLLERCIHDLHGQVRGRSRPPRPPRARATQANARRYRPAGSLASRESTARTAARRTPRGNAPTTPTCRVAEQPSPPPGPAASCQCRLRRRAQRRDLARQAPCRARHAAAAVHCGARRMAQSSTPPSRQPSGARHRPDMGHRRAGGCAHSDDRQSGSAWSCRFLALAIVARQPWQSNSNRLSEKQLAALRSSLSSVVDPVGYWELARETSALHVAERLQWVGSGRPRF